MRAQLPPRPPPLLGQRWLARLPARLLALHAAPPAPPPPAGGRSGAVAGRRVGARRSQQEGFCLGVPVLRRDVRRGLPGGVLGLRQHDQAGLSALAPASAMHSGRFPEALLPSARKTSVGGIRGRRGCGAAFEQQELPRSAPRRPPVS